MKTKSKKSSKLLLKQKRSRNLKQRMGAAKVLLASSECSIGDIGLIKPAGAGVVIDRALNEKCMNKDQQERQQQKEKNTISQFVVVTPNSKENFNSNKFKMNKNTNNLNKKKLLSKLVNEKNILANDLPAVVVVPKWRIITYKPLYKLEGTENLNDDCYEKRHQKHELEEKKIKRLDMRRQREEMEREKLLKGPCRKTSAVFKSSVSLDLDYEARINEIDCKNELEISQDQLSKIQAIEIIDERKKPSIQSSSFNYKKSNYLNNLSIYDDIDSDYKDSTNNATIIKFSNRRVTSTTTASSQ